MFTRELFLGLLVGGGLVWIINWLGIRGFRPTLDRLTKQLADREGEINRLRALGPVDADAARLNADLTTAQSKIERLELALREAAEKPDMSATVALLKKERDDALAALATRPESGNDEEIQRLLSADQLAKVRISGLEAEIAKLRAAPAFPSADPEATNLLKADLERERTEAAALQARIQDLGTQLEGRTQELAAARAQLPGVEQELQSLRANFASAQAAGQDAESLRSQVSTVAAEREALRSQLAAQTEELQRLRAALPVLEQAQAELKIKEEQAQTHTQDLELQMAKVEEQGRQIAALEHDLLSARAQIGNQQTDLQSQLEASKKENELLTGESNFLKSELQRLRASADALESTRLELETAQSELSILRKANLDLQEQSRNGRAHEDEIQSLRSQLVTVRSQAASPEDSAALRQRVAALGQEIATLSSGLAQAYAVIEGLRSKLGAIDREDFVTTIGVNADMQKRLHDAGILNIDDLLNCPSSRLLDILGWTDNRLAEVEQWQRAVKAQRP